MRGRVCGVVLLAVLGGAGGLGVPALAGDGGPWVRPVAGGVVRGFDPPATRYGAGHRGVDLAAAVGEPVRAAGAGRVSYAGLLAGRGVVVVVHGQLRTTYEPVAASVHVGQAVGVGAVLGRLTTGGHCTGGCLHWGLLRGDVYLDPLQLLHRGPSRLLPVPAGGAADPGGGAEAGGATSSVPRPVPSHAAAPALQPVAEPRMSLRAAQLPWGAAAVVTLLAGLLLLRLPRPRPPRGPQHRPPEVPAVDLPPPAALAEVSAGSGRLVDLSTERSRRRIM